MFLRDAAQADLVVGVGKEKWRVPLFTLDDFVAWGAEVDHKRLEDATQGMDEKKRFEYTSFYFVPDTGLNELLRLAHTPAGVRRICQTCLCKAVVFERDGQPLPTPEPVDPARVRLMLGLNLPRLGAFANTLLAADDPSRLKEEEEKPVGSDEGEGGENPLSAGGKSED